MTDKQMNRRPFAQHQQKTSGQMRQQQRQKHRPEGRFTSPHELGGQPGQQNAGSGQGKNSLNNMDIDTSGKTSKH